MTDGDFDANRIFAGVRVFEEDVAAGVFDVTHEVWRRVDATFLAHEADSAVAVNDDTLDFRKPRPKAVFHLCSPINKNPRPNYGERGPSILLDQHNGQPAPLFLCFNWIAAGSPLVEQQNP